MCMCECMYERECVSVYVCVVFNLTKLNAQDLVVVNIKSVSERARNTAHLGPAP